MTMFRLLLCLPLVLCFISPASLKAQTLKDDKEARLHFDRAMKLSAYDSPQAEQEYRLAIAACDGYYPEAWQELSRFLQRKLRFTEAIKALQIYIEQSSGQDRTAALDDLADLKRAAELQERIDTLDKISLEDLLEFTSLVAIYGQLKDAVPYAEQAIRLYPNSSRAYLLLANFLPTDQKERRLALLKKAIELEPNNADTHAQLAWYYFSPDGNIKEAIAEFRKALKLSNGSYADAWRGLGIVLTIDGQTEQAVKAYQNYLRTRKMPSRFDNYVEREIMRLQSTSKTEQ